MPIRFTILLAACLGTACASMAQVDYYTVASESYLLDGGGVLSEIEIDCMDFDHFLQYVFFNEATGDLVSYVPSAPVGSRTTIIRSNEQIDADFGGDVTDCQAITFRSGGEIYAVLTMGDIESVYKTEINGSSAVILAEADGTRGIDVHGEVVWLARASSWGSPEDGIYTLSTEGTGQTPIPFATHPDLDLYDISVEDGPDPISTSSKFGKGEFNNVVVSVLPTQEFVVSLDPFSEGIFTHGTDGGLRDVEGSWCLCGPGIFMFNNSYNAPEGEQWGQYGAFEGRIADEETLLLDPDIFMLAYSAPDGTHLAHDFTDKTKLYFASVSDSGGTDGIFAIRDITVPVELLSFNAVIEGTAITLNWATASETNNAGFEVQLLRSEGWDALGFVEGHGTTTEVNTYSFMAGDMTVGTHTLRLKQIDFDGAFEYSDELEVLVGTPGTHLISSAYPNPFNPKSQFTLAVAQDQQVTVELFNILGRRVVVLFEDRVEANQSQLITIDGAGLASGVYIVRVNGERFNDTLTVTLFK